VEGEGRGRKEEGEGRGEGGGRGERGRRRERREEGGWRREEAYVVAWLGYGTGEHAPGRM
jgi:hypothetical protein